MHEDHWTTFLELIDQSTIFCFMLGFSIPIWYMFLTTLKSLENKINALKRATDHLENTVSRNLQMIDQKIKFMDDVHTRESTLLRCSKIAMSLKEMKTLLREAKELEQQMHLKMSTEEEVWNCPIYLIFANSPWSFQHTIYSYIDSSMKKKVNFMTASLSSSCTVWLDWKYCDISFLQMPENKSIFLCFYGKELIGYYKRSGNNRNKKRSPRKVLQDICMNPDIWLISMKTFTKVCERMYNQRTFENCLDFRSHFSKAHFLLGEVSIFSEMQQLTDGSRLPQNCLAATVNLLFKMFIYHSISRKYEFFYSFLRDEDNHENMYDASSFKTEKIAATNLLKMDNYEIVKQQVLSNNYMLDI